MKIVTSGNIALAEYAGVENPDIDFDSKTGVLFVFGYNLNFGGSTIGGAKRHETPLAGYKQLTGSALTAAYDRLCRLAKEAGVNIDNCIAFYK